jgi:hypothetical protein
LSIFATEAKPNQTAPSTQQTPPAQRASHAGRFNNVEGEQQ